MSNKVYLVLKYETLPTSAYTESELINVRVVAIYANRNAAEKRVYTQNQEHGENEILTTYHVIEKTLKGKPKKSSKKRCNHILRWDQSNVFGNEILGTFNKLLKTPIFVCTCQSCQEE